MHNFYVGSKFYIKEIKGRYYVYIIENSTGGKQRHHYVGSLEMVIQTYLEVAKVWGKPTETSVAGPGFEPGSQGPEP
ncbi:putative integrase [Sulfuracidifex tepidarius]|uniref:putative integrase n=1 Tax=Sulfuracidifex tepidarius TaxID=1294262 RepID=UPI0011F3EC31|nr:putative integrase [Sulfuracidifex tepidarius]